MNLPMPNAVRCARKHAVTSKPPSMPHVYQRAVSCDRVVTSNGTSKRGGSAMLFHGQMVRVITIVGAAAVASALVAPVTIASAAPSRSAASGHAFALGGSIAGGIATIQSSQTLTFVFTETNQSKAGAHEDLKLTNVANVTVSDAGM